MNLHINPNLHPEIAQTGDTTTTLIIKIIISVLTQLAWVSQRSTGQQLVLVTGKENKNTCIGNCIKNQQFKERMYHKC